MNVTVLLFNNAIYGLTKGQHSPTSELGKVTKSAPADTIDRPFDPVSLALGAEASFVARTIDSDRRHLTSVLEAAARHEGAALVEVYQNCPVFNDGVHQGLRRGPARAERLIELEHGRPIVFGVDGERAVVRDRDTGGLRIGRTDEGDVVVHDAERDDPGYAFSLARLTGPEQTVVGVLRAVPGASYDRRYREVLAAARDTGPRDVQGLLRGHDSWEVGGPAVPREVAG